jgi:hypothetical protein
LVDVEYVPPTEMLTPAIGLVVVASTTVPVSVPDGPAVQVGNLNEPMRMSQSKPPEVW